MNTQLLMALIIITSMLLAVSIADIIQAKKRLKVCCDSRKKTLKQEVQWYMVFIAIFILTINYFGVKALPYSDYEEYKVVSSTPIVSLKTEKELSASFILGTGEISGDSYYKFYKINDHGNLQAVKILTSSIELRRSDTEAPQMVKYQKFKQYTIPWKIYLKGETEPTDDTYRVLIIPTNAIEVKYDANL